MINYLNGVTVSLSQLINAVLLGGYPNETVGSRAYREQWRAREYIDRFYGLFGDDFHCMNEFLECRIASRRFLESEIEDKEVPHGKASRKDSK